MATQSAALDVKRRARRRLVGAIALVLFLVIVPPLVMDLEPKPISSTLNVEIPEQKDSRLLLPPPAPTPQAEAASSPAVAQPVAEPAPRVEPTPANAEPPKAEPPKPEPPKPEPVKPEVPAATATSQSYIIAMATLSKKDNVKTLQAKLKQAGIKSYTEAVKTTAGEQTRVRAGPFGTKEAADKARVKLQQLGLNPGPVTIR